MIEFSESVGSNITLPLHVVDHWIQSRKMLWEDVMIPSSQRGETTLEISEEQFHSLASKLRVSPNSLFGGANAGERPRNVSVVFQWDQGYERCATRNGTPYYKYHHLVTTEVAPRLMPLFIDVLCADENAAVMNIHGAEEFVFVVSGCVIFHTETVDGYSRNELNQGDSVYIAGDTKHSFTRLSTQAQILAVNF